MTGTLAGAFAGLVCDLDGVVYAGPSAVPGAVEGLRATGLPCVYATNNASRTPADVAAHLRELGLEPDDEDVVTSSVAAARWLADRVPPGSPVLAVGGPGVADALRRVGLDARGEGGDACVAVLQGYGPDVTAAQLAEAAFAVRGGATWVATNTDLTLPTDRGPAPGNGALVGAVRHAVDVDPEVVGKPHPPMYLLAAARLGVTPDRVLAIGDRLETDVAGARAAGTPAALVLTGVHGVADAAAADEASRPTYVVEDLGALLQPYPEAVLDGDWSVRADARARVADGRLERVGSGIDADRASLDAVWAATDEGAMTPAQARAAVGSARDRGDAR